MPRSAKAGQSVTVKGAGALEGYDLKIKKGVNLLKPIAKQVLGYVTAKPSAVLSDFTTFVERRPPGRRLPRAPRAPVDTSA